MISVAAPGRVNLIGDHTDYTGGLVLPMVLERRTTIVGEFVDERRWSLVSADDPDPLEIDLPVVDPTAVRPTWGRYVAGVVHEFERDGRPVPGFVGRVTTDLPIGSGLSSSAALEVAVARVVGAAADAPVDDPVDVALRCQRAERTATGVPCGIMDQLCIAVGRPAHATLIDCHDLSFRSIGLPDEIDVVVEFVAPRALAASAYAERVEQTSAVESAIGPLRSATLADVERLEDPVLRRRARHVVTENRRVRDFVDALEAIDLPALGRLMTESHRSLSDDFETSTPTMDRAAAEMASRPGFLGARLTGGGFGGCVVGLRRK